MKSSIAAKLAQLDDRLDEVTRLLSSENSTHDMDSYRKLNRERAARALQDALEHRASDLGLVRPELVLSRHNSPPCRG